MRLTDENSVVLATWTRPEGIYKAVRGLNEEGVTEITRPFHKPEPAKFDQSFSIGWPFVKDGQFREILLIGHTPEKGDYPIMLFQHRPRYGRKFSPFRPWASPTERRKTNTEEGVIVGAFLRHIVLTGQPSANRPMPVFAFDVSLYRMLKLQLPFWLPHDEFLTWLEEARSA